MSDEVVVRVADAEVIRGQDGFSPIFSSEAIPGGHLVRVEDVNGPHEFNVLDGERGKTGATGAKGDKGDPGNYTKPDSGIPKTDLSSAVQASLDKADTAIQLGLSGASVGDLVRVAAVDANGKPTSWRKAPLCEIRTNPNLLDNWYFVGGGSQRTDATGCFPINQRGLRIYSGYGYSIDRWLVGSSLQVDDGYITIPAGEYFIQKLEPALFDRLVGLAVTASILLTGNVLLSGTAVINANYDTYFYQSDSVSLYTGISSKTFSVYSANGLSILAVKLELGSEQTLAHQENGQWVLNDIPDYGQELAKCQRYFYRWNGFYFVPTFSNGECYGCISHPVKMAGTPSITNVTYNTGLGVPDVNTVNEYQVVFHNFSTSPIILSYDAAISNLGG